MAALADADAALLSRLHAESGVVLCLGDFPQGSEFGIDYLSWRTGPKFAGLKLIPPGVHYLHWSAAESGGGGTENISIAATSGGGGTENISIAATSTAPSTASSPPHDEAVSTALAPRCGKFLHIASNAVLVWKWDSTVEEFVSAGEAEAARYAAGVRNMEFDDQLGPYPLDSYKQWLRLTTHVTQSTIERLSPVGSGTISMAKLTPKTDGGPNKEKKVGGAPVTASATLAAGPSRTFYCPLPGRRPKSTARLTASRITKYAFDRSQALSEVLQWLHARVSSYDRPGRTAGMPMDNGEDADADAEAGDRAPTCEAALLGEFQFAFVAFLIGQSADGFEQWKGLVDILCRSEDAMLGNFEATATTTTAVASPWCFEMFFEALRAQLEEIPEDFFVDIISGGNFMHGALRSMMNILDIDGSTNGRSARKKTETVASVSAEKVAPLLTDTASRKLVAAALKLKSLAEKRFKWRVTEDVPDHFGVRAGMEAMSIGTHSGDGLRDGFTSTGSIFGFADEDGPTVVDLNAVMF